MFKIIPGNHNYQISLEGVIKDSSNNIVYLPMMDGKVLIKLYNKDRYVDLTWLALISHFEVVLPVELQSRIMDIYFIKLHLKHGMTNCKYLMQFRKPFYFNKTYRIIPNFTNYAIDRNGNIINVFYPDTVVTVSNNTEYYTAEVIDTDKNVKRSVNLHRLLAFAWIENIDPVNNVVVNHKNSNKLDNRLKNLEWTTVSENNYHAFRSGVRTDNHECKVYDIETKEEHHFYSISEASRFIKSDIGKTKCAIYRKRKANLLNGRYEIKLKSDDTPWYYEDKDGPHKLGRYDIYVELPDGTKQTFYQQVDFKRAYKVWNVSNIERIMDKAREMYPDHKFSYKDNFVYKSIQAKNIETGEVLEDDSIAAFSRKLGMGKVTINNRIKDHRIEKGYVFRYKTDDPNWVIDESQSVFSPDSFKMINRNSGEELFFKSQRDAALHFDVDRGVFRHRLQNNLPFREWDIVRV